MDELLLPLLQYAKENGRVCPQPQQWGSLWKMLPNRNQVGGGWEPPLPLILAAWWEASDEEKRARLENHIRWAADHGVLDEVDHFLRELSEGDWHQISGSGLES